MRRKRERWPELVARWEASGESAAVFASRVGTSARTLCRWRRESRKAGLERGPTLPKIVEFRSTGLAADDRFEVRLGDGRSVGVPAAFEEAALARLLRVLGRAS
jgi:hypothetical protein